MANILITSDVSGFFNVTDGDNILLIDGVSVINTNGDGFFESTAVTASVTINGSVHAQDDAVDFDSLNSSSNFAVTVGATGVVSALNETFEISGANIFITNAGTVSDGNIDLTILNDAFIINSGSMAFEDAYGLAFQGTDVFLADADLLNSGTISNTNNLVYLEESSLTLRNSGTLISGRDGIVMQVSELYAYVPITVENSGTIIVADYLFNDISVGTPLNYNVFLSNSGDIAALDIMRPGSLAENVRIENSGTITANVSLYADTVNNVTNSGVIHGYIFVADGSARIENSGTINGFVQLAFQSDGATVINSGLVNGDVTFGSVDNLYNGIGDGVVNGEVLGGPGDDTLRGSNAADLLDGGADNDLVVGRGGDDTLFGDTGFDMILGGTGNDLIDAGEDADAVNGNAGDDTIDGGDGNDELRGGRDDDVIRGGLGQDEIRGDSGDDEIIGGAERDDMFGGSGRDTFIFETLSDSGTGAARDRIYDFQSGQDQLDISALAGPAFTYLGAANFTGSGTPELRAVSLTNGTLIYIDANGDGARDSDIYLIGTASVTEGDFLL